MRAPVAQSFLANMQPTLTEASNCILQHGFKRKRRHNFNIILPSMLTCVKIVLVKTICTRVLISP